MKKFDYILIGILIGLGLATLAHKVGSHIGEQVAISRCEVCAHTHSEEYAPLFINAAAGTTERVAYVTRATPPQEAVLFLPQPEAEVSLERILEQGKICETHAEYLMDEEVRYGVLSHASPLWGDNGIWTVERPLPGAFFWPRCQKNQKHLFWDGVSRLHGNVLREQPALTGAVTSLDH